ncbi:hypothetical protein A3Q56_05882, partial [Intoshia linei]
NNEFLSKFETLSKKLNVISNKKNFSNCFNSSGSSSELDETNEEDNDLKLSENNLENHEIITDIKTDEIVEIETRNETNNKSENIDENTQSDDFDDFLSSIESNLNNMDTENSIKTFQSSETNYISQSIKIDHIQDLLLGDMDTVIMEEFQFGNEYKKLILVQLQKKYKMCLEKSNFQFICAPLNDMPNIEDYEKFVSNCIQISFENNIFNIISICLPLAIQDIKPNIEIRFLVIHEYKNRKYIDCEIFYCDSEMYAKFDVKKTKLYKNMKISVITRPKQFTAVINTKGGVFDVKPENETIFNFSPNSFKKDEKVTMWQKSVKKSLIRRSIEQHFDSDLNWFISCTDFIYFESNSCLLNPIEIETPSPDVPTLTNNPFFSMYANKPKNLETNSDWQVNKIYILKLLIFTTKWELKNDAILIESNGKVKCSIQQEGKFIFIFVRLAKTYNLINLRKLISTIHTVLFTNKMYIVARQKCDTLNLLRFKIVPKSLLKETLSEYEIENYTFYSENDPNYINDFIYQNRPKTSIITNENMDYNPRKFKSASESKVQHGFYTNTFSNNGDYFLKKLHVVEGQFLKISFNGNIQPSQTDHMDIYTTIFKHLSSFQVYNFDLNVVDKYAQNAHKWYRGYLTIQLESSVNNFNDGLSCQTQNSPEPSILICRSNVLAQILIILPKMPIIVADIKRTKYKYYNGPINATVLNEISQQLDEIEMTQMAIFLKVRKEKLQNYKKMHKNNIQLTTESILLFWFKQTKRYKSKVPLLIKIFKHLKRNDLIQYLINIVKRYENERYYDIERRKTTKSFFILAECPQLLKRWNYFCVAINIPHAAIPDIKCVSLFKIKEHLMVSLIDWQNKFKRKANRFSISHGLSKCGLQYLIGRSETTYMYIALIKPT